MNFLGGVLVGAIGATLWYVYQAVQELREIDAANELAEIINFPYSRINNNNPDGDYE